MTMLTSEEIRKKFIDFFVKQGHTYVPSSSLIPTDPSVLLTTAGMQQFKPYFTGELDAQKDFNSKFTVSIQKSFRTSDIDEVGDERHNTFFEMLGNFSFGAYWKKEAITYAYAFITKELGLPISYVTIFKGMPEIGVPKDEESRAIWHSLGVKDIREEGIDDVFWGPTGTSGPCGPTTEIYCKNGDGQEIEVWNVVFNQFFFSGSREELLSGNSGKKLEPLKTQGVDTGMGLERLAMISQKTSTIFDTDLFKPITDLLPKAIDSKAKRIIADHIRASSFLIADGVLPANKNAGYILRRLIRRGMVYETTTGVPADTFLALLKKTVEIYGGVYPELKNKESVIIDEFKKERVKFSRTLSQGLVEMSKHINEMNEERAFDLYQSFGLPFEVIREFGGLRGKELSREKFEVLLGKHQEISRAGSVAKFGGHGLLLNTGELKAKDEVELKKVTRLHTATHLLQSALRQVLGETVRQSGSDITAERTRFDFTFDRKLSSEERQKVENVVNHAIRQDLPVSFIEMDKDEAVKTGALYFFKAKYGSRVKVYVMGKDIESAFSKEFCGGPHVEHTALVGTFKIVKDEAVSAGIRRIRGVVE